MVPTGFKKYKRGHLQQLKQNVEAVGTLRELLNGERGCWCWQGTLVCLGYC